jgi:MFS family permease
MLSRFRGTYKKFSKNFWLLMVASFVDMLGGSLIFPFFSLYLTQKFNVGMTEVGTMFLVWALTSGIIGNTIGGALADKFGRRANIIFGLIASAASALLMVLIKEIVVFYIVIGLIGIFEDIGGPARQAMVADLVPEELLGEAYGIFRIVFNLAAAIAPAIGGFMATRSFEMLFFADVILSMTVAVFVFFFLPETKPELKGELKKERSLLQTFRGYKDIFKDKLYMGFLLATSFSTLMYFNMNSSMSVYLVNHRGITPEQFGYILSLNAGMVVVLQIFFMRITAKWKSMLAIGFGNLLYVIGFTMYGIFDSYIIYIIAMVIITIGEMIYSPKEQMIAANLAPEDMRARYMAVHSFSWILPIAIGPLGAGFIMDNLDPRYVWFVAGFFGLIATLGFIRLHIIAKGKFESSANKKTDMNEAPNLGLNSPVETEPLV